MKTLTAQHDWCKHVITPVEVLPDEAGLPVVLVDPDLQASAEDNAAYGCDRCGVSMAEGWTTNCSGEPLE